MVGINGIVKVPEPAKADRAPARSNRVEVATASLAKDDVTISPEAREASEATQLLKQSQTRNEISAQRIERAKQDLERGTYRVQEVVRLVAARVSKHL